MTIAQLISRIEADAVAKGWTREQLWNDDFWKLPRGLACVLDPGDEVVEVRAEWILIRKNDGKTQRFFKETI